LAESVSSNVPRMTIATLDASFAVSVFGCSTPSSVFGVVNVMAILYPSPWTKFRPSS
jgi:hypothetical protein